MNALPVITTAPWLDIVNTFEGSKTSPFAIIITDGAGNFTS
jgi:hypothetical protein